MKFWQLEKFCLENAYTVKREGNVYVWKKNETDRNGVCSTVIETAEEIQKDIQKLVFMKGLDKHENKGQKN
jgi:hypothetical protein